MSFARFSATSDVYVYQSIGGWLECQSCVLVAGEPWTMKRGSWTCEYTADMLAHLDDHVTAGNKVPADTFAQLRTDADEIDADMAAERDQEADRG